ncbi:amidase [Cognatishimia sp. MH4019]|uniref:amidase family protein n=1 Tax=Cognatishimia sp. MH4019 TaxID=2854030 RepID=UPI001CD65E93|nr:amidase [Cognatishimia sp. MH4019]
MPLLSVSNDAERLVCDATDDLAHVVQRIENPSHRKALYAEMAARREMAEPVLNAFEARREACPEKVTGPLNGLPITVKDQIAVAGWPTGFGMERLNVKPDTRSATLVARLQALGAVVTGKTALPPNAMDFQTGNKRRGPTCNPHNPLFTAGGSTGGGAAAVASGMSLLDIGADLGGSLRIPAAWCGVTSYTPSEDLWPRDGMLRGAQKLDHFARIGLTAKTASDLRYISQTLQSKAQAADTAIAQSRLAIWTPDRQKMGDQVTLERWDRLSKKLQTVHPATLADPMTALFDPEIYRLAGEIIGYETGALVPWPIRWIMRRDRHAQDTSPGFVAHVHMGYKRDHTRHKANLRMLAERRASALTAWRDVDALLLPVSAVCAFRHITPLRDQNGVRTYDQTFETGAGRLGYFDALTRFTLPLTVLGWPVVTLPIGYDDNGIPIGAQLVGKAGADSKLLALAEGLQDALK